MPAPRTNRISSDEACNAVQRPLDSRISMPTLRLIVSFLRRRRRRLNRWLKSSAQVRTLVVVLGVVVVNLGLILVATKMG